MLEDYIEVFMDNFSVFGDSFESYLAHLEAVLTCYEQNKLLLNWKIVIHG